MTVCSHKQEDLLFGLKNNDALAISRIYESCFPLVRYFVTKNSGSVANAEDVFQESLIILFQKLYWNKDFLLTCSISTYLFQISRRLWLKYLIKNKKSYPLDLEEVENSPKNMIDDSDIQQKRKLETHLNKLDEAMGKLGEPCSGIIKAFYDKKKTMKEISEIFGYLNESTAKTQKYKCLIRLRKIFFSI